MIVNTSELPGNRDAARNAVIKSILICSLLLAWLAMLSSPALAMKKITVTPLEWDALPRHCQAGGSWQAPRGRTRPQFSKREKKLWWSIGGWHYCTGLMKVRRAESMVPSEGMIAVAKDAIRDIDYSLSRLELEEPWAAEMSVTRARALRLLNERDKARDYITMARQYHPDYAPAYIAMALLEFDEKRYAEAVAVLSAGNDATQESMPELIYYLGLAHFYNGNIDAATLFEQKARSMGFPLDGLAKKIASYEGSSAN